MYLYLLHSSCALLPTQGIKYCYLYLNSFGKSLVNYFSCSESEIRFKVIFKFSKVIKGVINKERTSNHNTCLEKKKTFSVFTFKDLQTRYLLAMEFKLWWIPRENFWLTDVKFYFLFNRIEYRYFFHSTSS